MNKEKQTRYSEIFGKTIQGEGQYTGIPTSWVRFFSCNLECNGFGQADPTNPDTYELPYNKLDVTNIDAVEDLPVFEFGCDSSYSWSKKYRHLAHLNTVPEMCDKIQEVTASKSNPKGRFLHPVSGQDIHMCFTGGEPIMSQAALIRILEEFDERNNLPNYVTIETNGTRPLKEYTKDYITQNYLNVANREWFWSISPKLFTTSGEKNEDAINPNNVAEYWSVSDKGQLKFVVNGSDETWDELERVLAQYRAVGVDWPVWIMPVGARGEEQEAIQAMICEQSFERGYNFAARVHAWVFDNVIGK